MEKEKTRKTILNIHFTMIPFLLFCSILVLLEFIVEQQVKHRTLNIKYWLLLAWLILAFIYEIEK